MFDRHQIELILARLSIYWRAIFHRKWLIIIGAIIFGTLMGIWAYRTPVQYTSLTLFHPEATGQSGQGMFENPLAMILGNGVEGSGAIMMIGVLKSRNISESVAADSVMNDSAQHLIADVILEAFPKSINPVAVIQRLLSNDDQGPSLESKIITGGRIIRDNLLLEITEEGFIEMKFSFIDKDIVKIISFKCIEKLDDYYRRQKTEKAKNNADFFSFRADSVKKEIDKVSQDIAGYMDGFRYGIQSSGTMYLKELEAKQTLLTQMYVELVIASEQAKAQQQKDTPVIQVLDYPKPPYIVEGRSVVVFTLAGVMVAILILSIFFTRYHLKQDLTALINSQLFKQEKTEELEIQEEEP